MVPCRGFARFGSTAPCEQDYTSNNWREAIPSCPISVVKQCGGSGSHPTAGNCWGPSKQARSTLGPPRHRSHRDPPHRLHRRTHRPQMTAAVAITRRQSCPVESFWLEVGRPVAARRRASPIRSTDPRSSGDCLGRLAHSLHRGRGCSLIWPVTSSEEWNLRARTSTREVQEMS